MSGLCHKRFTWPIDASRGGVARWKGWERDSLAGHTYFASGRRGRAQGKGGGGKIRMVYLDRFLCVSAGMLAALIRLHQACNQL